MDLNVKPKTVQLLDDSIGESLIRVMTMAMERNVGCSKQ